MTEYLRIIEENLVKDVFSGKAIILVGARQTGKTTLVKRVVEHFAEPVLWLNGEDTAHANSISNQGFEQLKRVVEGYKILVIDEGQKVAGIGDAVKLLVDHFGSGLQVIVTGSSTLNLLDATSEPLTGRKFVHTLYPLTLSEIKPKYTAVDGPANKNALVQERLIFGSYPEVVTLSGTDSKIRRLKELTSSYLYRDILEMQAVRNPRILDDLVRALALQIGNEVSYNELSQLLGIDRITVERYVDLLEKSFVLFRLPPYFRNKRKEIAHMNKVYFYDLGIRNAVLDAFNPLDVRSDIGALWENYMIVERLKVTDYKELLPPRRHFWRTFNGTEIDLVEDRGGKISGYEFKWNKPPRTISPPSWQEDYVQISGSNEMDTFLYPSPQVAA